MARIYIGRSTGIGSFERHVVLKMILPEKANDHTAVQMFLDEARLAASLNHQNVAQVFEVGEDGGIHFLAMEYVHGQDLRALLAKAGSEGTRVPLELALTVVAGAAAGLNHAHERRTSDGTPMGIVHRDVSPSNIMIGYDGAVKLLDFGIAKATSRSVETQSGIIKGKFAYMAPEQCRGRDVDRRSDVFSLGIILYEVTTQHRCFRADSDFDTMHRIVTGDVVRPTRLVQGYPQALEAIVMKALALDITQRYQSAGLLLEAVESFSVAARMSLSTMSLGRFMRDMFGDVQEPWLMSGRIHQPPQPREQTISNTNASGEGARESPSSSRLAHQEEAPLHLPPGGSLADLPDDRASHDRLPHERSSHSHLPHGHEDVSRGDAAADWSAKGYPAMTPSYAAVATPPPEGRLSSPNLPPMAPQIPSSVARPGLAGGSQAIPPLQFVGQPGSSSGPAHGALPMGAQAIARTRQGYTGAPGAGQSESSYPHYQPPPDPDEDVDLQPRNRLLYVGFGIVLVGIIVLLAISIADSGSGDLPPPPPRLTPSLVPGTTPGSGEAELTSPEDARGSTGSGAKPDAVKPEAFRPETAAPANGSDAGAETISDESITIHIVTVPPEADVLLAGKVIGMTPLDTKIRRSTGFGMLTVHHAKFEDVKATIDLSGDYRRELTLVPVPDEPAGRPPIPVREHDARPPVVPHEHTGNDHGPERPVHEGRPRTPPSPPPVPPVKKCQPPERMNPYDTSCGGQPCPPCK
jgi:serine/threonine-protein kinase